MKRDDEDQWLTRWSSLAAGLLVQSMGGLMYIFGVYSNNLKTDFHFDQAQVDLIGTSGTWGGNLGIHGGFIADRYGPRAVLIIAMVCGLVGWGSTWYALNFNWDAPLGLLCVFAFLQGQAGVMGDLATLSTVGKIFPNHRGLVIGLCKSLIGLSGALATTIYLGLFAPNITPFLLFIAVEISAMSLIGSIFIRIIPHPNETLAIQAKAASHLKVFFVGVFVLAFALMGSAFINHFVPDLGRGGKIGLMAGVLCLFLSIVVFAATRKDPPPPRGEADTLINQEKPAEGPPAARTYSFLEAITSVEFPLVFFSLFLSGGAGLVMINNLGQIVPSLGGTESDKNVLVTILSVSNCGGRLVSGALGDALLQLRAVPRAGVYAIFTTIMGLAFLLLSLVHTVTALYPAVLLVGTSYGAYNALAPTLVSELFGQANFGAIYAFNSLSLATASYVMATFMASKIYMMHSDGDTCTGAACFTLSFIICAGACGGATLLQIALLFRSKARYRELYPVYFERVK